MFENFPCKVDIFDKINQENSSRVMINENNYQAWFIFANKLKLRDLNPGFSGRVKCLLYFRLVFLGDSEFSLSEI